MPATIFLDTVAWDLVVDANGNIAMASEPYSLAQDAASAVLTFQGEVFYDTTQGVPYFQSILGKFPPLSFVKAKLAAAAATVPGVATAQAFISSWTHRNLSGQVQVTDVAGRVTPANFAVANPNPNPLPFGP